MPVFHKYNILVNAHLIKESYYCGVGGVVTSADTFFVRFLVLSCLFLKLRIFVVKGKREEGGIYLIQNTVKREVGTSGAGEQELTTLVACVLQ